MKKNILYKVIILLVYFKLTIAAIPTMEGLFRNGINPDIVQDLAVLVVKQVSNKVEVEQLENVEGSQIVNNEKFYKILYNNTAQGPQDIIVAIYDNVNLEDDNLVGLKVYRNEKEMISGNMPVEKKLSAAILNMFALNSSVSISAVLKSVDEDFMTNKEMVNKDKKDLLEKYRRFLVAKKDYEQRIKEMKKNGAKIEDMEKLAAPISPLNPENVEEKNEMNQIMANSLYVPNKMIKLTKDGSEFFWVLETQKITAKFKNDNHLLKVLRLNTDGGEVVVLPHEYATYQGEYLLPKKIEIKSKQVNTVFEVQNYYLLNSKNKNFSDRIDEYKKTLEKKPKSDGKTQEKDGLEPYFI